MIQQVRFSQLLAIKLVLACLVAWTPLVSAQEFDVGGLFAGPKTTKSAEPEFEIALDKSEYKAGDEATLQIKLTLPAGGFTYAQANQTGAKPRFKLTEVAGLKAIEKTFQADRKPKEVYEAVLKKTALKFYRSVTWTRKYQVTGPISVLGDLRIPICDDLSCRMYNEPVKLSAKVTGVSDKVEVAANEPENSTEAGAFGEEITDEDEFGSFGEEVSSEEASTSETFPLEWTDGISNGEQDVVKISSELVKVGDVYQLKITADVQKGWHVYSTDPQLAAKPAEFKITKLNGLEDDGSEFKPDRKPKVKQLDLGKASVEQKYFTDQVVWTKTLKPTSAEAPVGLEVDLLIQPCQDTLCLNPDSFTFQLGTLTSGSGGAMAGTGNSDFEANEYWINDIVIPDEDVGFSTFMLYAFLGGLILNAMPCVLPVLAIKILGFVKQAGEDRSRIVALNGAYAAGVISVFMVLATLAVVAGMGWGGLFQKTGFNLVMTCFIFAMSLSLLGLFELPIPGLFGSAAGHQKEGLSGAFLTGVFATLLATPCSGPFLGATLAWSVQQTPQITYLIWFTMGLGMASPYLLLGAFPKLISWLPKPGNWMVWMKEASGYILLGTVIFFFSYIEERFKTPLLIMLLGTGAALSIIGRAPATLVSRLKYWQTRISALLCVVIICGGAYMFGDAKGSETLDWKPFSTNELMRLREEGKTVLIDFSAEWCISCKTVEQLALNTKMTKKFVDKYDVVTLYADYTENDPEIKKWLGKFESESIPLTVIFPANRPNHPIILRDLYFQSTLLMKLRKAVKAGGVKTAESNSEVQATAAQ